MNRIFECWFGEQGSGKTFQLRRMVERRLERPSIRAVFVLAPPGEWSDLVPVVDLDYACSMLGTPDHPKAVCVDVPVLGDELDLERLLSACKHFGDCLIVIDEAWAWFPVGRQKTFQQRQPELFDGIVRGRHIERWDGQLRPLHIMIASQQAGAVSHVFRENAFVVMIGQSVWGGDNVELARRVGGPAARDRVLKLQRWEWTAARGRDPRRG